MKPEFIVHREGRAYVTYAGLLDQAHQSGLVRVATTLLQAPDETLGCRAIVAAEVQTDRGTFGGIGEAVLSEGAQPPAAWTIDAAELRAKAKALRAALNVHLETLEERFGSGFSAVEQFPNQAPSSTDRAHDNLNQAPAFSEDRNRGIAGAIDPPRGRAQGPAKDRTAAVAGLNGAAIQAVDIEQCSDQGSSSPVRASGNLSQARAFSEGRNRGVAGANDQARGKAHGPAMQERATATTGPRRSMDQGGNEEIGGNEPGEQRPNNHGRPGATNSATAETSAGGHASSRPKAPEGGTDEQVESRRRRRATPNQIATITKLSKLLGTPEQADADISTTEASMRIAELARLFNEREPRQEQRSHLPDLSRERGAPSVLTE
jgi:hypothetical protein